ncbi:hypothetical protein DdX_18198 [Ditylenchus destructor]|uniref:Uncharacterized protein n=1 Tax=Ditylenchus destructor TaxID=166010 RepID=A0AAD4MM09_9BILA|nr:hypothetical protein DdX_18198 [Ditylenchus destructor]
MASCSYVSTSEENKMMSSALDDSITEGRPSKKSFKCDGIELREAKLYSDLLRKLSKSQTELSACQKDKGELENAYKKLKMKLDNAEEKIQQLTRSAAIKRYKESDAKLDHTKERLKRNIAKVNYLHEKVKRSRKRREREQRKSKTFIDVLQTTISNLRKEVEELKVKLHISEQSIADRRLKERQSNEILKGNQKNIQKNIAQLRACFIAKEKTLKETAQKLIEATERLEKERARGKYLDIQLEQHTEELKVLQHQLDLSCRECELPLNKLHGSIAEEQK